MCIDLSVVGKAEIDNMSKIINIQSSGGNIGCNQKADFFVLDASVGFRLPERLGIISIEARNLFDEDFRFQDSDLANPRFIPDRVIMARFTLSF